MRNVRLSDEEIEAENSKVPNWVRHGDAIRRRFTFGSFRQGIVFVNQIANAAESADHHPDIDIRYDEVILGLTTHAMMGLTLKDFELARQVDVIAEEMLK